MRPAWGVALAGAAVVWGEWLNRRWSRTLVSNGACVSERGTEAVVVLGYHNPGATINVVNRWRVRAGLRSVASPSEARVYLGRQRPDLAEKVVPAEDYRPGEWLILKPALALYGLWTLRGVTAERSAARRR